MALDRYWRDTSTVSLKVCWARICLLEEWNIEVLEVVMHRGWTQRLQLAIRQRLALLVRWLLQMIKLWIMHIKSLVLSCVKKRRTRTKSASSNCSSWQRKLGIVIDYPSGNIPFVHAIKETSVLHGQVRVADLVLAVDEFDCRGMHSMSVSRLSSKRSDSARTLKLLRISLCWEVGNSSFMEYCTFFCILCQ